MESEFELDWGQSAESALAASTVEAAQRAPAKAEQRARKRGGDEEGAGRAGEEAAADAVPEDKAQRNFTDPDSRIMKTSDNSFHQCYNAQAVVDDARQVIVATRLDNDSADAPTFKPMVEDTTTNCGTIPPPPRGPIPKDATVKQRMARKLRTKKARPLTPGAKRSLSPCSDRSTPWTREREGLLDDPLFPTRTGRRLSRDAVERRVATHTATATSKCPSLTGKRLTPHVLRHTCAMALLHAGVDTSVIALWLGHEDVRLHPVLPQPSGRESRQTRENSQVAC